MSPSKLNSLLIGVLFAIVIALSGSVMAQDMLRLWKPYSPESFGGGRRSNDGVYSSLSGIFWSISTPTGGYIGATTTKGKDETRLVFDVPMDGLRPQTNSVKINMMSSADSLGTRFEVGNRRGHHGWLVSGYGLPSQSHSLYAENVSMTIRDEGRFSMAPGQIALGGTSTVGYLWGPNSGTVAAMTYQRQEDGDGNPTPAGPNQVGWVVDPVGGGYIYYTGWAPDDSLPRPLDPSERYGYIPVGMDYYFPAEGELRDVVVIAPLPIAFDSINVNVRSQLQSADLVYTYRLHPFVWGSMELLAGARYWDFEDGFGLTARNEVPVVGTMGDVRALANGVMADGTQRAAMLVNAKGYNRVFGPQVGMKLSRQNARWSFNAEGRLTAGINAQTVKTEGYITPHVNYMPIALQNGNANTNFGHRQNKTYFSPMGELRLSADWQWTEAVSIFGAVDGMFAGNVARGVRITDYVVRSDGTIFGIRGNDRNTSVLVYGFETGIKVRR